MLGIIDIFPGVSLRELLVGAFDVLIVAFLIYQVLLIIKDTRAFQVLIGLLLVALIWAVSEPLQLYTLNWILHQFLAPLVLIIVILFQDDIRRGLARVGKSSFLTGLRKAQEAEFLGQLVKATVRLSKKKIGALIVLEREVRLKHWLDSGILIDAKVTQEMITSVFLPTSPIHDGALVIRSGRLLAAGVILPLTQDPRVSRALGTRHRAALGVTELTDAIVIVVSEEDGSISVVEAGRIERDLDAEGLRRSLEQAFRADLEEPEEEAPPRPQVPAIPLGERPTDERKAPVEEDRARGGPRRKSEPAATAVSNEEKPVTNPSSTAETSP